MNLLKVFASLLFVSMTSPLYANGSSTHGGDGIRLTFAKAREIAAMRVESYRTIDGVSSKEVSDWLQRHKNELASDIRLSKHVWTEQKLEHDAMTSLSKNADITFSRPLCSLAFSDQEKAAELLIHESVHHLGEANELFADAVALSITKHYHLLQPNLEIKRARWIAISHPTGSRSWNPQLEFNVAQEPVSDKGFVILDQKIFLLDFVSRKWSQGLVMPQIKGWTDIVVTSLGDSALIWGNQNGKSKAIIYNPVSGQAKFINASGMPTITRFSYRTASQGKFVIWGSPTKLQYDGFHVAKMENPQGGIYDIAKDSWTTISTTGAAPKFYSGSVQLFWTSTNKIVTCCQDSVTEPRHMGAVFDPSANTWSNYLFVDGTISSTDAAGRKAEFSLSPFLTYIPLVFNKGFFVMSSKRDRFSNLEPTAAFFSLANSGWKPVNMAVNSPLYGHNYKLFANNKTVYAFNTGEKGFSLHALDLRTQNWDIKMFVNDNVPLSNDAQSIWTGESLIQLGGSTSNGVNFRDFGVMIDTN